MDSLLELGFLKGSLLELGFLKDSLKLGTLNESLRNPSLRIP